VGGACWDLKDPSSPLDHTCQGRAFIKNATCDPSVCTYPYGYVDPVKKVTFYSTQPPFGQCTDVNPDPNACIGDDTLHAVLPKPIPGPTIRKFMAAMPRHIASFLLREARLFPLRPRETFPCAVNSR
jgi:hypothetical protein